MSAREKEREEPGKAPMGPQKRYQGPTRGGAVTALLALVLVPVFSIPSALLPQTNPTRRNHSQATAAETLTVQAVAIWEPETSAPRAFPSSGTGNVTSGCV